MKKRSILLLATMAILSTGCAGENNGDSSSLPSSSSSSSYNYDDGRDWSNEEKELLKEYCGSVIPFPGKMIGDTITFKEVEEDGGSKYLEIRDNSVKYRMGDYYKMLAEDGWDINVGYDGEANQTDTSGINYTVATKKDETNKKGYEIVYLFKKSSFTNGGIDPSCCIIQCYNDLSYEAAKADSFSADDADFIKNAIGDDLPYISMGSNFGISNGGYPNVVILSDLYAEDLTHDYYKALIVDGYVKNEEKSNEYHCYCLEKTLDDGATIDATLRYVYGNSFTFIYTANPVKHSSWPTDFVAQIKEVTGIELPIFGNTEENVEFRTYVRGDTYFLEGNTSIENPTWDYTSKLEKTYHLSQKGYGMPYVDFNETVAVTVNESTYDDEGKATSIVVSVRKTTPTSTFSSSWPSEVIASTIKDILGVDHYDLPAFTDLASCTSKGLKYNIQDEEYVKECYEYYLSDIRQYPAAYSDLPKNPTEEDIKNLASSLANAQAGIKIEIEDKENYLSALAYDKLLVSESYHREISSDSSDITFEDKDGKVAITISTESTYYDYSNTTIFIHGGCKKAHTPELKFYQDTYEVNAGSKVTTTIIKDMLPYDVTYSIESDVPGFSVDEEKGIVKCGKDVAEGSTATLTATINVDGETIKATCTIVATVFDDYSPSVTMDVVLDYLAEQGYEMPEKVDISDPGLTIYSATLTFENIASSGVTLKALEDLVETYLVPPKYEIRIGDAGKWTNVSLYNRVTNEFIGNGNWVTYYFLDEEGNDKVMLEFAIYKPVGVDDSLALRIITMDCIKD